MKDNGEQELSKVTEVIPMAVDALTLWLDAKYQEGPLLNLDAWDQLSPVQEVHEEHCIAKSFYQ